MFILIFYRLRYAHILVEIDTLDMINIHSICRRIGAKLLSDLMDIVPLASIGDDNTLEVTLTNDHSVTISRKFDVKPKNLDLQAECITDIVVAEAKLALAQHISDMEGR